MTNLEKIQKGNVLICYKGGGYDGCFWEWNYCYISESGEFEDIYSSGYNGVDSLEKLDLMIKHRYEDIEDVYDIENEEDIDDFQKNYNPGHVVGVVNWFSENINDFSVFFKCDICGEKSYNGISDNSEGCGGIMVQATSMYCEDCLGSHRCDFCGEIDEDGLEEIDGNLLCSYCANEEKEKIEKEMNRKRLIAIAMYSNYDCCNSTDNPLYDGGRTYMSEIYKRIKDGVRREDMAYEHSEGACCGAIFYFLFKSDMKEVESSTNGKISIIIPKGTQFGFMSRSNGSCSLFEKTTFQEFSLTIKGETSHDKVCLEYDDEMSYNLVDIVGEDDWIQEQVIKFK